ncbi:MAG: hypothetical protein MUF81_10195 [Verrucomicrobia bacterium]|nr:hypothetical protein [Verrucomicrobiota bacterium]
MIHLPLIEEPFFRFERARVQNPDLFSVGSIHTKDPDARRRHAQIEKPRLNREPARVWQQAYRKRIFKRFFDFSLAQRTIQLEGWIIPIKLHIELTANKTPIQCRYNVFTHESP